VILVLFFLQCATLVPFFSLRLVPLSLAYNQTYLLYVTFMRIKLHAVSFAEVVVVFVYSDHDDANDTVDELWTSWVPWGQSTN